MKLLFSRCTSKQHAGTQEASKVAVTAPTAMFNLKNITGAVVVRGGILMTNKPRVTNLETRVTVIKLVQKERRAVRIVRQGGDVFGLSSFYYGIAIG